MPYVFRKNGDEIESHAVKEMDYNVQVVDQIVVSKELLESTPIKNHSVSEIYYISAVDDYGATKVNTKNGYAVGVVNLVSENFFTLMVWDRVSC